ncbi:polysaccharide export protein EpsE [Ideonella margarita]|uniref:Polysaccharide export protein EpsE n=1 Tax=Ideonella margarita TaxID=2984191 RepID=A0ABU9C224_9BURK
MLHTRSLRLAVFATAALLATWLSSSPANAQQSAANVPAEVAEYKLGPGDVIRIAVYQNLDLSLETRLSDGGVISYPLLGGLRVGGLSVGEAEKLIASGLVKGDFVKNPQVTVVLMQARGSQVSVLGQVGRPGRYALEQAGTRLSDVLALAGGVLTNVGGDTITVVGTRNQQPFRKQVDLPTVFTGAQRSEDLVLQGNDVVYVERAPLVYIYGEVQRPGQLRLERGMTLLQGLAAGGGLTQRGTEKGIRVHRRSGEGKPEVLQPAMDETLRDGDVIYVRESLF